MREILFKAKVVDDGKWVEGYLGKFDNSDGTTDLTIIPSNEACENGFSWYCIDENTICQYTGLTDRNGNKIWENDIIFVTDDDGNSGQIDTGVGEIDFLEGLWYISGKVQNSLYDINKCFQIEVIGNIFDNHELMEGK